MGLKPSKRVARNALIQGLRERGYTYDAIADELLAAGFTPTLISRQAVSKMVRRYCPHLLGNLKRRLELPRLIRRADGPEIGKANG